VNRTRLLALAAALIAASAGAQPAYRPIDEQRSHDAPGLRIGLSAGAMTYFGPDLLNVNTAPGSLNGLDNQDGVTQTRPAILGFLSFPLGTDRLYGRLQAGVANLGADFRADVPVAGANPFLTNEWFITEADLLFNIISPRRSLTVPYLFTGAGVLVADPFGQDDDLAALDHDRTAWFVPAGVGVDFRVTRNVSLFLEAGYRFSLGSSGRAYSFVSGPGALPAGGANSTTGPTGDPCEEKPWKPECQPKPPSCDWDPTKPGCVLDDDDARHDRRFDFGSLMGGVAIGFAPAPVAFIPPPPPPPEPPPVIPEVVEQPPPPVCDLVELNSVYFEHGSATLTPGARSLLAENVQLLLNDPECCIFVDGYTDASEQDRFGLPLAGRRAQAVYDYYLEHGVAASRMHVRNRGVSMPDCDKEDEGPGCQRGRRVETVPMDCERFQMLLETAGF
jgi:outer membrane protein OmpA-like peptidoglycan-associated protein